MQHTESENGNVILRACCWEMQEMHVHLHVCTPLCTVNPPCMCGPMNFAHTAHSAVHEEWQVVLLKAA